MADGIYTSLSGALAQIRNLDVLSNNLANLDTVGFKSERLTFKEKLSEWQKMEDSLQSPGASFPYRMIPDDKKFVETGQAETWFGAGPLDETGNSLDLALTASGKTFFAVDTPQGVRYTRDGAFTSDGEGRLTTNEGHPVRAAGGGHILLHPGSVHVDVDGTVYVGKEDVGALEVVEILDQPTKAGHSLFAARATQPADLERFEIRQGYLERSNVNAVRTMTDLIAVHRTFEIINTTIKTFDQMDRKAINEVGKPAQG